MPQLNDLYLIEPPSPEGFQISREHFAIERAGAGFVLVDRQSACGTIVGGKMLGHGGGTVRNVGSERAGGRTELLDGSLIIVGSSTSPYVFRFVVQV